MCVNIKAMCAAVTFIECSRIAQQGASCIDRNHYVPVDIDDIPARAAIEYR